LQTNSKTAFLTLKKAKAKKQNLARLPPFTDSPIHRLFCVLCGRIIVEDELAKPLC